MLAQRRDGARDRGSVSAELAVALPAVVLVLACCLSGMQVAGQQLRLQDASAAAARTLARGGDAAAVASRLAPGSELRTTAEGDLVCAVLRSRASLLWLVSLDLRASSCALAGGL